MSARSGFSVCGGCSFDYIRGNTIMNKYTYEQLHEIAKKAFVAKDDLDIRYHICLTQLVFATVILERYFYEDTLLRC